MLESASAPGILAPGRSGLSQRCQQTVLSGAPAPDDEGQVLTEQAEHGGWLKTSP